MGIEQAMLLPCRIVLVTLNSSPKSSTTVGNSHFISVSSYQPHQLIFNSLLLVELMVFESTHILFLEIISPFSTTLHFLEPVHFITK